jgi:hypothetical protein
MLIICPSQDASVLPLKEVQNKLCEVEQSHPLDIVTILPEKFICLALSVDVRQNS